MNQRLLVAGLCVVGALAWVRACRATPATDTADDPEVWARVGCTAATRAQLRDTTGAVVTWGALTPAPAGAAYPYELTGTVRGTNAFGAARTVPVTCTTNAAQDFRGRAVLAE